MTQQSAGPAGFHHCPRCGAALSHRPRGDRVRPHCDGCGKVVFHNPAVGVAVVLAFRQVRRFTRPLEELAGTVSPKTNPPGLDPDSKLPGGSRTSICPPFVPYSSTWTCSVASSW